MEYISSQKENISVKELKSLFEKHLLSMGIHFEGDFIVDKTVFFKTISPHRLRCLIFINNFYTENETEVLEWAFITCQREKEHLESIIKNNQSPVSSGIYHVEERMVDYTEVQSQYEIVSNRLIDYRRQLLKKTGPEQLRAIFNKK